MKNLPVLLSGLLLIVICSMCSAENTRPIWTASRIATPPDAGNLARGGDWSEASSLSGLACFGTGLLSLTQPVFWVGYDDVKLYIAWRVQRNGSNPFQTTTNNRDGGVWNDDAVEIFLDPDQTRSVYYQLIVSPNGTIYDSKGRESAWNGNWSIATAQSENAWAAVVSIPFSELGTTKPAPNAKWGLNLAVDRTLSQRPLNGLTNEEQVLAWSVPGSSLHETQAFGTLTFGNADPLKLVITPGKFWTSVEIRKPSTPVPAYLTIKDKDGREIDKISIDPKSGTDITSSKLQPGKYSLSLNAGEAGKEDGLLQTHFIVTRGFESQISYLFSSRQLYIKASNADPSRTVDKVKADVYDATGRIAASVNIHIDTRTGRGNAKSKSVELKAGKYKVVFEDASTGNKLANKVWSFNGRPKWLGTAAGRIDDNWLPKPWTPVKVKTGRDLQISVWGRDYKFGKTGFPAAIKSAGNELLAAPMNLVAETNGTKINWKQKNCKITSKGRGAVGFVTTSEAKGVTIKCTGRAEFDGFIKLSFNVTSNRKNSTLDNLILNIPIKRQFATLIHHYPRRTVWTGIDLSDFNARALTNTYWSTFFLPHVWIGNEDKGIQWLCESARGWRPADPDKAIELIPGSSRTTMRLNIIGKTTRIGNGLQYTFMFQASPIKPMSSDRYYMGYLHSGGYGMEKQPYGAQQNAAVRYPLKGNLDFKKGTVEITLTPGFNSTDPAARNTDLFNVRWPADKKQEPDNLVCLYWNQDDKGMREVTRDNGVYTRTNGAPFPWKPGEEHTVALVWGGKADGVYIDGKLESTGMPGALISDKSTSGGYIELGGPYTNFNVRQIRISSAPRSADQLGKGSELLKADGITTLLDRFDNIRSQGKSRITKPIKSANALPGIVAVFAKMEKSGLQLKNVDGIGAYTQLDYQRDLGAKVIGYHEYWTDYEGDTSTTHVKELKSLTDALHKNNMKLILYTSWMIADINPEYPIYSEECMNLAQNMFIYTREPKQTDYTLCASSIWHDRVIDGIADMFRKYKPDGIYTDGLTYPGDCTNDLHGCGYVDEDGERKPTQNILSIRDAMKRIYRIMEKQGRKTYWVAHTSGSITLPTLSFVDAYLDGEHLTGQPRPFQLPIDMFRAEYMGRNFGIPALFLVYQWNSGMTEKEGFAECMLHDTELGWNIQYTTKAWKLWKDFRPEKARFIPYWKSGSFAAPKDVLVSQYIKPDGDGVVIAVNIGKEPVTGSLDIKADVMTAKDAFVGTMTEVDCGLINDTFKPWEAKVYRVKLKRN